MEKMKQEIVEVLTRKAGLDQAAAERAVDVVIDHVRQNPGRIAELLGFGGFAGMFGGGGSAGPRPGSAPPPPPPPRRDSNPDVI